MCFVPHCLRAQTLPQHKVEPQKATTLNKNNQAKGLHYTIMSSKCGWVPPMSGNVISTLAIHVSNHHRQHPCFHDFRPCQLWKTLQNSNVRSNKPDTDNTQPLEMQRNLKNVRSYFSGTPVHSDHQAVNVPICLWYIV